MAIQIFISCVLFFFAALLRIREKTLGSRPRRSGAILIILGLIVQWGGILFNLSKLPDSGIFPVRVLLLIVSAIFVSVALSIESITKDAFFSIFLLPPAAITTACSYWAGAALEGSHFSGLCFILHIISTISGQCFFFMAAIAAAAYLFSVRKLKSKNKLRAMLFFPPLARLDSMTVSFAWTGWLLFNAGLLLGAIWSIRHFGDISIADPKKIISIIASAVYLSVLILRAKGGLSGPKLAGSMIAAFLITAISLIFTGTREHWYPGI